MNRTVNHSFKLGKMLCVLKGKTQNLAFKNVCKIILPTRSQHCHPLVPSSLKPHTSKRANVTLALQKEISKQKGAPRCQSSSPWTQFTLLYFLSSFQRKGTFNIQNLYYYSPYIMTLGSRPLGILYHTSQFCSEGLKQETPFQIKWRIRKQSLYLTSHSLQLLQTSSCKHSTGHKLPISYLNVKMLK